MKRYTQVQCHFCDAELMESDGGGLVLFDDASAELQRLHDVAMTLKGELARKELAYAELEKLLVDAQNVCDEWELKNGDAPHRTVNVADRIRVNAGLLPEAP